MKKLGLIGFPLSHSHSKQYWEQKFSSEGISGYGYSLYPLASIEEFPMLLKREPELAGLNVTIPYKESILAYLNELDSEAEAVRAVNTISLQQKGGKLWCKGFNTDLYGFRQSFEKKFDPAIHKKALVLGSGGASKAVRYVLDRLDIPFAVVSRYAGKGDFSYDDIDEETMRGHQVIINATPVGMYPNEQSLPPLPYQFLTPDHYLFDLVYNPAETAFLAKGKEHGTTVQNGLGMLHLQADRAWEIWNLQSRSDGSKPSSR
ncbi:MAG: shikimate dehydrogenase [Bacteroidia bacterium]